MITLVNKIIVILIFVLCLVLFFNILKKKVMKNSKIKKIKYKIYN